MSEKKVTVRLVMEGGKVVETELVTIGSKGKEALSDVATAAKRVGTSTGAMRSNVQNAAFQVQDFFVQVAGGTSISRALGQQLPQLLGSLGLFGVLAGTAAAALIPLIGYLFQGEDRAKAFQSVLDDLNKTMAALKTASAAVNVGMPDLGKQYGQYAAQAKDLLDIQKQIAQMNATRALAAATQAIPGAIDLTGGFGSKSVADLTVLAAKVSVARAEYDRLTSAIDAANAGTQQLTDQQISDMQGRAAAAMQVLAENNEYVISLNEVANAFGVTEAAASQLAIAASRVRDADNTQDRLAATQALAKAIWDSSDGLSHASPEAVKLYESLVDAWHAGLDLAALDIAGTIGAGADEASRLATMLRLSAGMMGRGQPVPVTPGMNFPDYAGPNHDLRSPFGSIPSGLGTPAVKTDTAPHGSGGSAQNDSLRQAQQLFDATRTEAEKYAAEQANLNTLLQSGAIDADLYQRAIAMIKDKYGEAADAGKFFGKIGDDLKSSFLDLATTGENSFGAIADAIKRAAIQALVFGEGPLGNIFGGAATGGLAGAFGKAIGMPSFEGGGFTGSGSRSGGIDGRGGYAAILHPNEIVTDLNGARRSAGPATSRGGTTVQIIDQRSSGAAVESQSRTGPDGREIIVATIRDAETRGELDRGKRARFGLRPAQVTR